jgi:hypothetical protein
VLLFVISSRSSYYGGHSLGTGLAATVAVIFVLGPIIQQEFGKAGVIAAVLLVIAALWIAVLILNRIYDRKNSDPRDQS